ncbi:MAG: hypothetical protein ACI33S_00260 [Bacilli bacterium]
MSKEVSEKKKMGKVELCFDIFSIIFLIGFICFYGYRMIYYKNKFLPKNSNGQTITLLSSKIKENIITTGDGLYNEENNYIFKGENVNNYIKYSNMLFRVIKIKKDNTIEIILDDTLNYLSYDIDKISYNKSNLKKYLNDIFYKNINNTFLVKSPYCTDTIDDVNDISCNNIEIDYIKLLSLTDYLNSKNNTNSYLDSENIIWLNDSNKELVWLINNGNLSLSKPNELYQVKPVITLNNLVEFNGGDGSFDNPYTINENKSYFSSYVKLGNDLYRVYDIDDDILKLQAEDVYNNGNIKYQLSNNSNNFTLEDGLGSYLNNIIYNNLTYKDILEECEFNTGSYDSSYENTSKTTIKSKIGISSIIDPIFNKNKNNYYLSTPYQNDYSYIYNGSVYPTKSNIVRNISISVCINKNKISTGDGSFSNPYKLGDEA